MEEYGKVKSLKVRFHLNNTRSEAMICFFTGGQAQLAITEISTYEGWRPELYKPIRKSRESKIETNKLDNSNKEQEPRKNNRRKYMKIHEKQ